MSRAPRRRLPGLAITRRDFLNGVLLGAGAALLSRPAPAAGTVIPFSAPAPDWYGLGGIGDYAASHGNTPEVVQRAHELRDGRYIDALLAATDTGELFDVVIVGGGIAGLGAALEFARNAKHGQRCLLLENHPVFGGESKRNEFLVNGHHLIAPQGANGFSVPGIDEGAHASDDGRYYDLLGVPRKFQYQDWDPSLIPLKFGSDNFGYLYWLDFTADTGYFHGTPSASGTQVMRDAWAKELRELPYSEAQRKDLLRWRSDTTRPYAGKDFEQWLDGMSYGQYVEKVMGLGPHVSDYASPILAGAMGLGADAVSAYAAYAILFPGVINFYPPAVRDFSTYERHSFPGGNDGFARHFVKHINPAAISGDAAFEAILNGPIAFDRLDQPDLPVRMRLGATAVAVEHEGDPDQAAKVSVAYVKDGKLHRVQSRAVVMASGAWVNKHVVRDLPAPLHEAFSSFKHAAFLVANLALTNWRFMYDLGITACRYNGEFGFAVNVRQPMVVGNYRPPLHPNQPTVLSFYVPFYYPGEPVAAQCSRGRVELFSTSYAGYERKILEQMQVLFGSRFVPERDVAGIVLNRWGHAYVVPEPGFYFGRDGKPAAREIIQQGFGRIAFGHSELRGNQHWGPAAAEGARAMGQVLDSI